MAKRQFDEMDKILYIVMATVDDDKGWFVVYNVDGILGSEDLDVAKGLLRFKYNQMKMIGKPMNIDQFKIVKFKESFSVKV